MTVAQIAGILAAKRTSDLIPLCHPVQLNKVDIKCQLSDEGITSYPKSSLSLVKKSLLKTSSI